MGIKDSVINLVIRGRDLFSPAAKEAAAGAESLQSEIGQLNADLKDLGAQSKQVSKARELEIYGDMLRESMANAQSALASMQAEVSKLPQPSAEAVSALRRLREETTSLTEKYNQNEAKLKTVQTSLKSAGVDFSNLANEEKRLRLEATQLGDELSKLKGVKETAAKIDELRVNVSLAKTEYERTTSALKATAMQMEATTKPTQSLKDAHALARQEASRASAAYQKLNSDLSKHEASLQSVGISSNDVATIERELANRITELQIRISELNKAQKEIGSNNQLSAQLEKQKSALIGTKSALELLQAEFDQVNAAQREYGTRVAEAARNAGIATKAFEQNEAKLRAVKTQLDQAGVEARDLSAAQAQLAISTANASVKLAEKQTMLRQMSASTKTAATSIGSLTSQLISMASAYVGIRTITSAIKEMFSQGDKAELLQTQMNAVMGSIKDGEQATVWVRKFAKDTPLQIDQVTEAFTLLKAFGLDPMDGTLQGVVDTSYKLGKGFEGVQRISLALGQAWARQKLQGDEILQLVQAGVPVWDMLAKSTGKNTYELQRLSEQGALGRNVIKQLMDEIGKSSSGAAAANMKTLSGLISNAKDNLDLFYRKVAESGALDWLKKQLTDLNNKVQEMSENGQLAEYAQKLSDYLISTGESTKSFILNIGGSFDGLINGTNTAMQGLRIALNIFTLSVKAAVTAAMVPLLGFSKMLDGMAAAADAIGLDELAGKLKFASGAIKAEFDAFAAAAKEDLNDIADAASKMSGKHTDATDSMKKSMQDASTKSNSTSKEIVSNNNNIIDSAALLKKEIGESFSKVGIDVEQASGRIGSAVGEIDNGLKKMTGVSDISGSAIAEFLAKGFDSAKNRAEIQLLIDDMELMKSNGQLAGDALISAYGAAAKAAGEYAKTNSEGYQIQSDLLNKQKAAAEQAYNTTGLEKYKVAVGETTLAIQKAKEEQGKAQQAATALAAAYETVGVTSTAALQDAAAKHKAAFDQITAAGTESIEQQNAAFLSWAQAEIQLAAATGKPVPAMLEAMAAAKGLSAELNNLISTTDKQKAATANTETALSSLGITSASVMKKMAADAEAAYNTVANSANATLEEQKAAFMKYAEASLTANKAAGELPPPLLASQAAALGLSGSLETLKASLASSGAAAETASQQYDVFDYRNKKAATGAESSVKTYTVMTPLFKAATLDMSKAASYMSMSISDLNKEIETQDGLIQKLSHSVGVAPDSFGQWIGSINQASIEVYRFYANAARAAKEVQGLQTALAENPSETLINRAEHALSKYKELGSQNLSGLKSAIDAAKAKMDSLNSSVQSTLNSLRDQADELNNNNAAIENRRYQTQVAELEAKLAEAQAMQDKQAIADMKEALRLAQEIHNQKLATIKAEQAASKQSSASSSSSSSSASSAASTTTAKKEITIKLAGKTATVTADAANEAALDQILAQLESASALTSA